MFICPGAQTICDEPVVDQFILAHVKSSFIRGKEPVKNLLFDPPYPR